MRDGPRKQKQRSGGMRQSESDPWPPLDIGAMIAEMEGNPASTHWGNMLRYIEGRAKRLVRPNLGYRFDHNDLTQKVMQTLWKPGKLSSFRAAATTTATDI